MDISVFLAMYNRLEEVYGEDFRQLTAGEKKAFIHYAYERGIENLSDNLYLERPNFLDDSGGYGLFGPVTEGAYRLSAEEEQALREAVLSYAQSEKFLRKAGLLGKEKIRKTFFSVLNSAEFVGSNAGGAAGFLRLVRVENDEYNPLVLRFALQIGKGPGNLWGVIPTKSAMRHELLHYVREAESLSRRGISLFKAEKECKNLLGKIILMLREEAYVWFRTLNW